MRYMPYEKMQAGTETEDAPSAPLKRHTAPDIDDEPGRTPGTAEGSERTGRKGPVEEPGRTPGLAEGE